MIRSERAISARCRLGRRPHRDWVSLTVLENLEMGAFTRADPRDLRDGIDRTFVLFPARKEWMPRVAGTLSGGDPQMLAIGRALMAPPRGLLMDEPSMGLAPILVEQIAYMALTIAYQGYVLQTGSIVLQGGAGERPANEDVKRAYLGE